MDTIQEALKALREDSEVGSEEEVFAKIYVNMYCCDTTEEKLKALGLNSIEQFKKELHEDDLDQFFDNYIETFDVKEYLGDYYNLEVIERKDLDYTDELYYVKGKPEDIEEASKAWFVYTYEFDDPEEEEDEYWNDDDYDD